MENQNISVVNGNIRFNYRVAVIIKHQNRVLLENAFGFWNMIGGRVQFGESSRVAAHRELKEELNIEVDNLKLINISENFFEWNGKNQHEMLFVYETVLDDSFDIVRKNQFNCLDDENEIFVWQNTEDVEKLDCRPEIIKQLVKRTDDRITHNIAD